MSTLYDGDNTLFPTSLTIPSDGDAKPVSSINPALEGLADRTAYLARISKDKFGTVVRVCKGTPVGTPHSSTSLPTFVSYKGAETYGGTQMWQLFVDAGVAGFSQVIDVPHGCTLQTAYVSFRGASGHGAIPDNPFLFTIKKHKISSAEFFPTTIVSAAADTSSVAVYEAFQQVALVCNEVIDNSQYLYFLYGRGEFGSNSIVGGRYHGLSCVLSVNDLDVGAS
jgi:hypothetical protein